MFCTTFLRCGIRLLPGAILLPAFLTCCYGQPLIYNRSIYNAASYTPNGIPGGSIAQGSIFSVFGAALGPKTGVSVSAFPLGNSLGGTTINVVQGNTTVAAIPVYVSATQINAIMPSTAPLGAASIQVTVGATKSNLAPIQIVTSVFGIFTALGTGIGPGIIQNFITATNQPINQSTVTAQNGQAVTLWGTGLGPIQAADNLAPPVGNLPGVKVEVFVGGVSAQVLYSGRAPCCSGTDQVVFNVPATAPDGCWVPVYVRTNGVNISNFVTMAISPTPGSCTTDVLPTVTAAFLNGQTLAENIAVRATTRHDVGVWAPVDATGDYNVTFAFQPNVVTFPFNPALAFPPSGTCTEYLHQGDLMNGSPLPGSMPTTIPLDYGLPLLLTGPNGIKTLAASFSGANASYLGGLITNNILPSSLYLDPGAYTLQGFGGMNIGTFLTKFTVPTPPTWTNRLTTNVVTRSQPLTLNWSGGDSGQVVAFIGFGIDLPSNSSAVFACIAPQGATSFTIPSDLLANLPATRPNPLQSRDVIYMMTLSGSSLQAIQATGLQVGLASFYSIAGKTVVLQ
jgi:uncharacterized protein (TIGR03437 family)